MRILIKGTLFFILFITMPFSCFSQENKNIIFLFNEEDTVSYYRESDNVYVIRDSVIGYGFKEKKNIGEKIIHSKTLEKDIWDMKTFQKEKSFFKKSRDHNFFLFITKDGHHGHLISVKLSKTYIFEEGEIED